MTFLVRADEKQPFVKVERAEDRVRESVCREITRLYAGT
jgi:hypothetical protein